MKKFYSLRPGLLITSTKELLLAFLFTNSNNQQFRFMNVNETEFELYYSIIIVFPTNNLTYSHFKRLWLLYLDWSRVSVLLTPFLANICFVPIFYAFF